APIEKVDMERVVDVQVDDVVEVPVVCAVVPQTKKSSVLRELLNTRFAIACVDGLVPIYGQRLDSHEMAGPSAEVSPIGQEGAVTRVFSNLINGALRHVHRPAGTDVHARADRDRRSGEVPRQDEVAQQVVLQDIVPRPSVEELIARVYDDVQWGV